MVQRRWYAACLLAGIALCALPTALSAQDAPASKTALPPSGLRLVETEAAISVMAGSRAVVVYNKLSPPLPDGIPPVYQRSGFLHPITSPGGKTVTATFPFDHPHQHGVFSAWVKTTYNDRPVDFWNLAGGTGRVLHERVVSTFSDAKSSGFEVDLVHRLVQDPAVDVLRERWKVTVYPSDGRSHCFDLRTTQTALTDAPLIVARYHYGGMALRGPVRWLTAQDNDPPVKEPPVKEPPVKEPPVKEPASPVRASSGFINDHRSGRRQGNHQHAKWVALYGTIDEQPATIAVLCHADNFRAPQAARLHPTKPYFCFAPCVDGAFQISKTHSYAARYRYLITDAKPDPHWLDEQWRAWCRPPAP